MTSVGSGSTLKSASLEKVSVRDRLQSARLYGIADLGYSPRERIVADTADLLRGGVQVVQLRAKGMSESEIEGIAEELLPLCRQAEVPFIVNDFVEIALRVGADGVHLGQDDGALQQAREVLPSGALVGRSTHSLAQAKAAMEEGADYIGFGPLFPTPTKQGRPGIGLENIAQAEHSVGSHLPMFCIGGIKLENLDTVLEAGARRVVIVSGLLQADDIAGRCREVRDVLQTGE